MRRLQVARNDRTLRRRWDPTGSPGSQLKEKEMLANETPEQRKKSCGREEVVQTRRGRGRAEEIKEAAAGSAQGEWPQVRPLSEALGAARVRLEAELRRVLCAPPRRAALPATRSARARASLTATAARPIATTDPAGEEYQPDTTAEEGALGSATRWTSSAS